MPKPWDEDEVVRDADGRFSTEADISDGLASTLADLRTRGEALGREILIITTPDGEVLGEEVGGAGSVDDLSALEAYRATGGPPVVLAHNHPNSLPLAPNDLDLLADPLVERVVAIGHDGSLYTVARGAAFPTEGFFDVRVAAFAQVDSAMYGAKLEATERNFVRQHALNLALHKAGVTRYHHEVSEAWRARIKPHQKLIDRAAARGADAARDKTRAKADDPRVKEILALVDAFDWEAYHEAIEKPLSRAFGEIVAIQGSRGATLAGGSFDVDDPFVKKQLTGYVGNRIVDLDDTTKKAVADLIRTMIGRDGGTPVQELGDIIADEVRRRFDGYAKWRADRIARAETAIAYNTGNVLGYRQAGVTKVRVSDGDDDEECRKANGQVWPLEKALAEPIAHPGCERDFAPVQDE